MTHSPLRRRVGARPATRLPTTAAAFAAMLLAARPAAAQMHAHAISQRPTASIQGVLIDHRWVGEASYVSVLQTPGTTNPTTQVSVAFGLPAGQRFLPVIARVLDGRQPPFTLQIETLDYDGRPTDLITLQRSQIRQFAFPALDASSKDKMHLVVAIAPGIAQQETPTSAPTGVSAVPAAQTWPPSNFKFQLDGVDVAGVRAVDSLVVDVTDPPLRARIQRGASPTRLSYHPVVLHLARNEAAPFRQWLASGATRNGSLTLFDRAFTRPVLRIDLSGLRVRSIQDVTSPRDNIPETTVTLDVAHVAIGGGVQSVVAP